MSIQEMALQLLSRSPRIANNPQALEMIKAIQSGDSAKGQEIADNICRTYGVTREQGLQDAMKFFNVK